MRPPKVHPARGSPAFGFAAGTGDGLDQTPAVDPTEPEPVPRCERDQTRSW